MLVPEWPLLVLLLLFFGALIAPVQSIIFRPLLGVLAEREEKIAGTRRRGERLTQEGAEVLERYQGTVREAREQAEQARKQVVSEARAETAVQLAEARRGAETELERARREVETALVEARGTLRAQAQELARVAATAVLGRPLS